MVFGSEFGLLPADISGSDPDRISKDRMNGFLSGVKSNWIDWDRILDDRNTGQTHMPEHDSQLLSGRLLDRNSHTPLANKIMFLSSPGKNATFQYSLTDDKGIFRFLIPISDKEQDLIIQPEENDKEYSVEIVKSFSEVQQSDSRINIVPENYIPTSVVRQSTNYQINRIYGVSFSSAPKFEATPLAEKIRFYGKPDIELVMDDYIKLPVMQEVFYELMPGVSLRSKREGWEMLVVDPADNRVQKKPPMILIDGVIINDANIIAGLDPLIVERIDAVKVKYFVGNYIFYGIINVITRAGDLSCTNIPDKALRIKYRALDPVIDFIAPDNAGKLSARGSIPDFRNTVYWNPSVQTSDPKNCSVSFRAPDQSGEYQIEIEGMSPEGRPVYAKRLLKVY